MNALNRIFSSAVSGAALAAALAAGVCSLPASAQTMTTGKLGFVNTERILRDSAPALRAQKKLESEFLKREQDLRKTADQLKHMRDDLDRNGITMSDSDRAKRESQFTELNRDFQRKQRELREDENQRRNEELARIIEQANRVIAQIAEQEKYDLIIQDAVYRSPRIDITDKVIKALEKPPAN